ncbi:MAG: HNH endonuclease [Bacteroidota bacterium]|nr:HNH endonuclease [Bacteroidota bacterium]
MNYEKHYEKLIETRKFLIRKKSEKSYYESHHILPRCLGGNNSKENLILLTGKEHFIAHLLLTKMYKGEARKKMYFAFWRMCQSSKNQERIKSASQYGFAKELFSIAMKGRKAWNKGINLSDETKLKISESHKGKKISSEIKQKMSDSQKGRKHSDKTKTKIGLEKKGKKLSEEHRKKLSISHQGHITTNETKLKMSEIGKERIFTEEWRKKLSEAMKGNKNGLGHKHSDETKKRIGEKNRKHILKKPKEKVAGQ